MTDSFCMIKYNRKRSKLSEFKNWKKCLNFVIPFCYSTYFMPSITKRNFVSMAEVSTATVITQPMTSEPFLSFLLYKTKQVIFDASSVTIFDDLLHFRQLFKACGNNYFAQISQMYRQFLWSCQNISFWKGNHFWATLIDIWWFLATGHTGCEGGSCGQASQKGNH